MQKYSRDIVSAVLAANDIVDIVGVSVELKAAGTGRLKGLCPFHHEKTPSFTVDRHRQAFHCFGCGKGGDALSFLISHDGLSFVEALRKLADRAGIRLPAASGEEQSRDLMRTQLLDFNKFVVAHCRAVLEEPMAGAPAREYLRSRALSERTMQRFGLGYLPDGWSNLLDAARQRGYKQPVLEASGLFKRGERGTWYDFFRHRVMFPIRDIAGNVVAFGGRDLGDSSAKYINSPETAVYKKSRVLYGLHEARETLRQAKQAILVEGYFDLLRCFDSGIENVVASCGTALTSEQAALIRRYVPEVVVVYDGDPAGIKAALKGIGVLTAAGLSVRAMALPDNQDPDDFIRAHGAGEFEGLVAQAPDFISFYVQHNAGRLGSIEGRTEVATEIFEILRNIEESLRVDEYLRHSARAMGLDEYALRREYAQFCRKGLRRTPAVAEPDGERRPLPRDDAEFVAALLQDSRLLEQAQECCTRLVLPAEPLSEVLGLVFRGEPINISQDFESDAARALYSAALNMEAPPAQEAGKRVALRLNRLVSECLRSEAARVREAIQEAERRKDTPLLVRLAAERVALQQRLEKVGAI